MIGSVCFRSGTDRDRTYCNNERSDCLIAPVPAHSGLPQLNSLTRSVRLPTKDELNGKRCERVGVGERCSVQRPNPSQLDT